MLIPNRSTHPVRVFRIGVLIVALLITFGISPAQSAVPHLGYGFNVAAWDVDRLQAMGFNWIKVFDVPQSKLDKYVLLRLDVHAQTGQTDLLADLDAKLVYKDNIDAWEIGNEVNLDASYGWNASPDAMAYKHLLCAAYNKIKASDPDAIVVSAGLAPVGRVQGSWNGHPGHNGAFQDEREFLKELLTSGGGACLDVVGLHPYGFSADYDAAPDVASGDPTQNCVQGLCFRTAEKFYEVMQAQGLGDKKLWATEFGWLVRRPPACDGNPSWGGRDWQMVTAEKQASNLVGAYRYADEHWPWMGAMFVFNLNFNTAPPWFNYDPCDQMLFYSVEGRPAEGALAAMPKNIARLQAHLKIDTPSVSWFIAAGSQPITLTAPVYISNDGWQSLVYTATVDAGASVAPGLVNATGSLSPTAQTAVQLSFTSSRPVGMYTGMLTVSASPSGQVKTIALELRVVDQVYQAHLPLVIR